MRIAIFSDTYPPQINGVATSTFNLVKTLRNHGHDVLLVTVNTDDGGKTVIKDNEIYIPGFVLKKLYGYRIAWIYNSKVFKFVKEWKPDIIHYQTDASLGIFARIIAKKLHLPIVYTYHTWYADYTYYVTKGYFDRFAKKAVQAYSISLTKNVTGFICPSNKTKEQLRIFGADNYVDIVPTGIDFSLFDEKNLDMDEFNQIKQNLRLADDDFVFLILGRLAKEKSMDVSIRGVKAFKDAHPEVKTKLVIVGMGPAYNELQALVDELGLSDITTFVGAVSAPKVPLYYHLASIYTSASLTETQGLTFMEAMSAGAFVLARFDDNLTGTIEDNETGFFFTDEKSFVKKAYQVYSMNDNERARIKANAYKIIEKYSIDTFYERVMEVYLRGVKAYW